MASVEDVVASLKTFDLDQITQVEDKIADIKKKKALKELSDAEERVNQLRVAAGMKRRPASKI